MVTINTRPSNGVSWSIKYTIVAGDVADGTILFDFDSAVALNANVQILDASGLLVDATGVGISFPANGQVQVDDASTPVFVADGTILLQANRAKEETSRTVPTSS